MAQFLYLDNRDGFGLRDFTRYLSDAGQFFTHNKNEPQLFDFSVVNIDATADIERGYAALIRSASGLLGYYRLGEPNGTTAIDSSGGGHNATYQGGFTLGVTGSLADGDKAVTLNGTSGFAKTAAWDPLSGLSAATFEAWVKGDGAWGASQEMVVNFGGTGHYLSINNGHAFGSFRIAGTQQTVGVNPPAVIDATGWHHVVLTWQSGDSLRLYVDGSLVETSASYIGTLGSSTVLSIGVFDPAGTPSGYFGGSIDEVAIYKIALSPDEIEAHYLAKTLVPTSDPEFVVPKRGAYVKFYDDDWDSRTPEVENGLLFTGYVTEDPDPAIIGIGPTGETCYEYRVKCTSDEFLANSKRLPTKTYVNKTRGFILKDLLQEMFAGASPFPFNTAGVRDGGTERLFQVDTGQKWSELAAAFAGADGFTYYLIDGYVYYGPEDELTTYGDSFYKLSLDKYDPRFTAEGLNITRVSRDIVNDVIVLGLDEPSDIVREHFVSDGYQGFHNLAFEPFGVDTNLLINDDLTSDIDTSVWEEKDTGSDYIQFFDGALNIVGGPGAPGSGSTARTVYLLARRPIEMSGIVEFRDGEIYFPASPTGTGIIGGLYTDPDLSNDHLWSGWYLDCSNRVIQPLGIASANVGTAFSFVSTRHYILRRTIQVDRPVGSAQTYYQASTGVGYAYDSVTQPQVYITFSLDEINDDDPAAVTTSTTVLANYTLTLSNPPDFLLYALAAPNNCHYVANYCLVQKPQQAVLKVNGQPVKLGAYIDGGRAIMQAENGHGKLSWYATPTGSEPVSYANAVLGDAPVAYWRLDEPSATTRRDASGNNHGGTESNVGNAYPTLISSDPSDYSNNFDGSTSYISGTGFQTSSAGAGSLEAWFQTTSSGHRSIYSTRNAAGAGEYLAVIGGQIGVGSDYGGSTTSTRTGLNDGRKHHVVVTFRNGGGSNCTIYIDGVLDKSVALPRFPPSNTWYIGKDVYVDTITPGAGYFNGLIDEVAIYKDIELTGAQVKTHYDLGTASLAQVVTVPPAGSSIELSYYRKQQASARMRSTESINTERERYRDDGVRQRVIRADEITPSPRTSEECLALAQAYLNDSARPRYEGAFTIAAVAGTPTALGFWPRPGDVIECTLDLPTGNIEAEPLTLQSVSSRFLGKGAYELSLGFGPINRWDIVIRNLILKRKSSFDDPVIQDSNTDELSTVNQAYPYPADVLDCTVTSITATQFDIALAGSGIPADVVNYEVRKDDTGWGNVTNTGYLTRFRSQTHTFTRPERDLLYYIRPYNAAGLYSKRSAVIRVACPTTNTFTMTGVTGNVSSTRIRVIVPIPRDPDYAGVIVKLGDASSASADSATVYQGNGDTNLVLGNGVEVLLTVGKITVDIPNPGLSQAYVWVNTYNLLKLEGTAQIVLINSLADGTWGSMGYNGANFSGGGGPSDWTVQSGDQITYAYTKNVDTLTVSLDIQTSSVANVPSILQAAIPLGLTAIKSVSTACIIKDAGVATMGSMFVDAGGTVIKFKRLDGAAFTNSTNTTSVQGTLTFQV